jgi:hypothetical protein
MAATGVMEEEVGAPPLLLEPGQRRAKMRTEEIIPWLGTASYLLSLLIVTFLQGLV